MLTRTPVTSVNFRVLLTFPRLAHGLFPLLSFPLKTFLVHSRLCFSSVHTLLFHFQSTLPRKPPFQSRANIHESYVLQEKEQARGGSGLEEMLLPLLMVFACVPTICLFSTQQMGMSLFEKTDLGLDGRLEEK